MPTHQEIHDQQKGIWNSAAPGWKKWDAFLLKRFEMVSEALIQAARLKEGQEVLELACGTGEPGIPAAKRVGKGRVTGTDLAEEMMAVAVEKARAQGVSNYVTKTASALSLPFSDGHFDAVLCRWGIMFFPDPPACLRETLRVMKPGAYAAFATWNVPGKNPHAALPIGVAVQKLGLTPTSPDSPGPLRYADARKLAREMDEAGFGDVQVQEAAGIVDFDSLDHFWEYAMDVIGPFRAAMQKAEPALRDEAKTEVLRQAGTLLKDDRVHMTYSSWIVSGKKA
jgi:ubiquinone/menaquinone biosynthesis C-methylase UbiE